MPDSWKEIASEVLQENTAQAIHQQLEQLENQKDRYSRRWIWELFQNALDATPKGHRATIQIRHRDKKLAFSHDGAPFHQKEILHLIFHGSTKREREGVIGRYGTGFLTTHVLSRQVRISGKLSTEEEFTFVLDRSGTTPSAIAQSMARSFDSLTDSIQRVDGSSRSITTFEYDLDDSAEAYVRIALSDLHTIAPLVLAFNSRLGSLELDSSDHGRLTLVAKRKEPMFDGAALMEVGTVEGENIGWRCCLLDGADFSIVIPLDDAGGIRKVSLPATLPRLFVSFPLFGTEELPLPFILNCPGKPTERRDGLFLGQEDTEDNIRNKAYIEGAWKVFSTVLEQAAALGWEGLFELARLRLASTHEWLDNDWFNDVSRSQLTEHVMCAPLVRTAQETALPARDVVFPLPPAGVSPNEFLPLVEPVYGRGAVPAKEVVGSWVNILGCWWSLASAGDLKVTTVDLPILGRRIGSFKDLASVQSVLQAEKATLDVFAWLNDIFTAMVASGNQDILDKERVLPDQNGTFQARSRLKRDVEIDEELKNISREVGIDIRSELLDGHVDEIIQDLLPPLTSETVSGSLLSRLVAKTKTEYGTPSHRRANAGLFTWFASKRRIDSLKSFPLISADTDQTGNEVPIVARDQLLGPPKIWPATARPFSDLFPAACIVSNLYADAVDQGTWEWLEDQHLCLRDPAIRRRQDVDGDDLFGLLEQALPREEEDVDHRIKSLEVADLAHLTLKDRGIIDGVRSSRPKCVLFLEFIVRHMLSSMSDMLKYDNKECGCMRRHSVHSSIWISVLKNRQWVYERKGHAARPTAANLGKLWRDSPELMASMVRTEVILFLRRLDVNASEIQRATSVVPESESLNMEKAMVALLAATSNDSNSLQMLARITTEEPDFIDECRERLKQRERVRLNQTVGASIEALFKAVFGEPELLKLGLRITRTGWGSDFCIEHDFVDESGEIAFALQANQGSKFLVELKSTIGTTVSMSEMQGSEAVRSQESFALCVVPLGEGTMSPEILRRDARFVPTIGHLLSDGVAELRNLRAVESQAAISGVDVDVLIQESEVVYRVKTSVWERGLKFDEFIKFLLEFFGGRSIGATG